jgi:hypothetical protein
LGNIRGLGVTAGDEQGRTEREYTAGQGRQKNSPGKSGYSGRRLWVGRGGEKPVKRQDSGGKILFFFF